MTLFLIIVGIILYNLLKDIKRLIRLMVVCFILVFVYIIAKTKDVYDNVVHKIKTEQVDSTQNKVDNQE